MNDYMRLALNLASEWRGNTSPNPLVGAVVVKDGKIVGQGAHEKAGEPHAEVHALNMAGAEAKGSTLYVTLEPCSHYGKTPPCTEKIIACGVTKVIAAMSDPNPLVAGRGFTRLREAGIEVEVGMGAEEAEKLNQVFIKYITTRKPYVILKSAISLDGKIATKAGDSKWITNEAARKRVHELRNEVDAVLIGKGTLLADNPRLNVRLDNARIVRNPQKVVLMRKLDITPAELQKMAAYQLSTEKPLILVASRARATGDEVAKFYELGVKVLLVNENSGHLNLDQMLTALGEMGITSLLLEGGSGVYTSFLQARLVDKVFLFQAPIIVGNDGIGWVQGLGIEKMEDSLRFSKVEYEQIGDNILMTGLLR